MFFDIKQGCYRCVFPEPPPPFLMNNCSDAGVLGPTTGIAGSITATLAINYFVNPTATPVQKIITFDSHTLKMEHLPFSQIDHCLGCHHRAISWPTQNFNVELKKIDLLNYKIIDIREHNEDRKIRLTKDELHIPFSEILGLPSQIPQKKLLIYCQSGLRSDYTAHFLRKSGFQAFSLDQGVSDLN
ncbi:hypothetical protein TUM19329_37170 (plasmid) [Legionella antarctica]|uniref:Rhodanese domain-containing protein n=1 Tax=Legionella antarctica TaxID=2708020 RepID=A0A6F8TBK6_9GAMM|nr:rhodanese-like domain-containing protein [Legionella antarctica]BCA97356.1 hypothetical protein TUM19329_37170 [Legionella antarctica]